MKFLYNAGIYLMAAGARAAAPFHSKIRKRVEGCSRLFDRMKKEIPAGEQIVWFHAASLGEFEQGRPVIEAIKKEHPRYKILLTFFSPSGYEIRKNYSYADYVYYLPFDTPRNARKLVETINPVIAIFIKYEFWLNILADLKKSRCNTYLISAIFRKNSIFFKPYGGIFRKGLSAYRHIFVQDSESVDLLNSIGIRNVSVVGDTRFDRVMQIVGASKRIPELEMFRNGNPMVIAGSTWPADEKILIESARNFPDIKFVIVPHEVDKDHIDRIIAEIGEPSIRWSEIGNLEESEKIVQIKSRRFFIIDTIGLLSSAYAYGDMAYIGGGFGVGIHSTLEAAAYGIPVAFGPNYHKFREAQGLILAGASESVSDTEQLTQWIGRMNDPGKREKAGSAAGKYVEYNTGATRAVLDKIFGVKK